MRIPNHPRTPAASISRLHHPLIRHRLLAQILLAIGLVFAPLASLHAAQPQSSAITVEAAAALVDSALPNTLGAKPAIDIKASFLRARIE